MVILGGLVFWLKDRFREEQPGDAVTRPYLEQAISEQAHTPAPAEDAAPAPDTMAQPAAAADESGDRVIPGVLELYPTYSAVGLELPYSGDANRNADQALNRKTE